MLKRGVVSPCCIRVLWTLNFAFLLCKLNIPPYACRAERQELFAKWETENKRKLSTQLTAQKLLPTSPGTMPLCLKLSVVPPLQNMRSVNVRDPLIPIDGPLPAPKSIASHPLFINRLPDITKLPAPLPFCDDKLPDMVTVSRVVIGASIDCDIDIPDTSMLGKGIGPSSLQDKIRSLNWMFIPHYRDTYSNSSW